MQPPPAFQITDDPMAPKRKPPWVLFIALGACAFCFVPGAAIIFPVFAQAREAAIKTRMMTNVKKTGQSLMLYAAAANDHYPPADRWMDASQTGNIDEVVLPDDAGQTLPGKFNHAMNSNLSGLALAKLPDASQTVTTYWSTKADRNANDKVESVRWSRKNKFTVVGLADTSARALKSGQGAGPHAINGALNGQPPPKP